MNKYKSKKHFNQTLANTQIGTLDEFTEKAFVSLDDKKKIVLIAGASSSGKGFTADVLARHLESKGMHPLVLSTDSYYKGVSRSIVEKAIKNNKELYSHFHEHISPLTEIVREIIEHSSYEDKASSENLKKIGVRFGQYFEEHKLSSLQNEICDAIKFEYEHINYDQPHMVNLRQLAKDVKKVLAGEKIVVPDYSFITGEPTLHQNNKKFGKDYDVVVVEGIFALRPELLSHLDKGSYVACAINCDIKTLLTRKLYRDLKIGRCSHTGEEIVFNFLNQTLPGFYKNIRPSLQNVDIVFNSKLSQSEIALKPAQKQFKVRLSERQYTQILAYLDSENAENHSERQIDHYLSPAIQDDSNILIRIREVNGKAVGLTIKIRQQEKNSTAINVDEFDLRGIISNQNREIGTFLQNFKNAGFEECFVVKKMRKIYSHKGFQVKIDNLEHLGKFAEFDASDLNTNALSFFRRHNLSNITHLSYYDIRERQLAKKQNQTNGCMKGYFQRLSNKFEK